LPHARTGRAVTGRALLTFNRPVALDPSRRVGDRFRTEPTRRGSRVVVSQDEQPPSVSITLSPTQVDTVVRSANDGGLGGVAARVIKGMSALRANGQGGRDASLDDDMADARLSRSLLRGLSILTCFDPEGEPRGIVEVAQELEMSPSTAHRYALTLLTLGLLERSPHTRKYSLPKMDFGETG
jgi:IclR helix-turn-helix domain